MRKDGHSNMSKSKSGSSEGESRDARKGSLFRENSAGKLGLLAVPLKYSVPKTHRPSPHQTG